MNIPDALFGGWWKVWETLFRPYLQMIFRFFRNFCKPTTPLRLQNSAFDRNKEILSIFQNQNTQSKNDY